MTYLTHFICAVGCLIGMVLACLISKIVNQAYWQGREDEAREWSEQKGDM